MMVAIKATSEEELNSICKAHKIEILPTTIHWWLTIYKNTNYYLCIDVFGGKQRGCGYPRRKEELGDTRILLAAIGRRMI